MAIEVFNRFEHKYLITQEQLDAIRSVIDKHMRMDKYCIDHSTYTIANLYYDTDDNALIRKSRAKPIWLCDALTKTGVRRVSFSKYGTEYKNMISNKLSEAV